MEHQVQPDFVASGSPSEVPNYPGYVLFLSHHLLPYETTFLVGKMNFM